MEKSQLGLANVPLSAGRERPYITSADSTLATQLQQLQGPLGLQKANPSALINNYACIAKALHATTGQREGGIKDDALITCLVMVESADRSNAAEPCRRLTMGLRAVDPQQLAAGGQLIKNWVGLTGRWWWINPDHNQQRGPQPERDQPAPHAAAEVGSDHPAALAGVAASGP